MALLRGKAVPLLDETVVLKLQLCVVLVDILNLVTNKVQLILDLMDSNVGFSKLLAFN